MKRLIFSDLHLNPWAYSATIEHDGFNSRLWSQWSAARQMFEDVEEFGVEYAYFCGDLFHLHGNVPTQALVIASAIFDQLRKRGVKIRAIPGNHDQGNRTGSIHGLTWLGEEEIYGSWDDGGLLVRGCPYTGSEEVLKRFLEYAGEDGEGMLLLHQGISGVPLSTGVMLDERLTPEMIPDTCVAYAGHYHEHRVISDKLVIPGSMTGHTWADIDQPKGWVITEDSGLFSEHRIQTRAPDFVSMDANSISGVAYGNFVRYTDPVPLKEQAGIRETLKEAGALSVEFPLVKVSQKEGVLQSGETITVEHIAQQLEKRETGRRAEVGRELREGSYEIP